MNTVAQENSTGVRFCILAEHMKLGELIEGISKCVHWKVVFHLKLSVKYASMHT